MYSHPIWNRNKQIRRKIGPKGDCFVLECLFLCHDFISSFSFFHVFCYLYKQDFSTKIAGTVKKKKCPKAQEKIILILERSLFKSLSYEISCCSPDHSSFRQMDLDWLKRTSILRKKPNLLNDISPSVCFFLFISTYSFIHFIFFKTLHSSHLMFSKLLCQFFPIFHSSYVQQTSSVLWKGQYPVSAPSESQF